MKIKNTSFSIAIATALLSWNIVAQAGTTQDNNTNSNNAPPENTNPDHNWMPQQAGDNFWQAPNWSNSQTPAQMPPAVTNDQGKKNPESQQSTVQAPALQVPTMDEKPFVTKSELAETGATSPTAVSESATDNAADQATNGQNQAHQNGFSYGRPSNRTFSNGMPSMGMPSMGGPSVNMPPQMPGYNNNYRPPMPQGYSRPPYQNNPYQRPFAAPMYPPMQYGYQPNPPANMYQGYRAPRNMNQPGMNQPSTNSGQAQQNNQPMQAPNPNMSMPNNVPPGYNRPYYNGNNNRFNNNNWGGNNFWGRSGPGTWTNPNKQNMEQGWDDMINAPSRMGTMPGGWNAPEISMPNPIDMGDQFQDNIQDLPEQLRNMDVGN